MRAKIFSELYKNFGEYISGEKISEKLLISRSAVLKHITLLKNDGAQIESIRNKGHKLVKLPNRLKKEYITPLLSNLEYISEYIWYDTIGSTNEELKKIGENLDEISIITTEEQTDGKGRRGRTWYSNKNLGIYTSILLKPNIAMNDAFKVTCVTAIAIVRAIKKFLDLDAKIKWPNDILINNKKISGTLTELSADFDGIHFIVCGFGINVNQSKNCFISEVKDVASSLFLEKGEKIDRLGLYTCIIDEFIDVYNDFKKQSLDGLIEEYKSLSLVLGKEVYIINGNNKKQGIISDIDNSGAIILKTADGLERIVAGEVSLRGVKGYV
jgi:BirA family transcriptional regulator, biotin operon repressor / biotin---[acetyl-CoA-carboxylase] ligase